MPRLPLFLLLLGLAACAGPVAVVVPPPPAPVAEAPPEIPGLDRAFLDQPLALDPAVRRGTLPNGLTYFIRANAEPRQRAELRLVVNAGSILEAEDQRGLAHFLEHMAFNGTERFPEQALVAYLEGIGMRFGPDLNAYTSFDETVYILHVPTDDAETLRTGFDVLREWAGSITLDPADVEAERGVILEEWRLGLGAQARLRDQQFPVLFGGSRYAERLPIGQPEVIRTAPPERLRQFYRDWYRPDLMAVVAVGDFDAGEVEATIRQAFADLHTPADAPVRPTFPVPAHDETRFALATDPELPRPSVTLLYKTPALPVATVRGHREGLIDALYVQMLNERLRELTRRPGAPFLGGGAFQGGFVRPVEVYGLAATAREGGVPAALDALLTESARVRLHGFTPGELDRARADLLRAYRRQFEERETTASAQFADAYVSHFLEAEPAPGPAAEFELAQELLPSIRLEEVDARAGRVVGEANRVVLVSAPEGGLPAEAELRAVLAAIEGKAIEPYEDAALDAPLLAETPPPGRIRTESRYDEEVGVIAWDLSNGARVVLRPTDFRADEVLFTAFSPGGTSLVPDSLFRAAEHASVAVAQGGLGAYSATDLQRFLAGTAAQVRAYVGAREEGLSGSASPEDLETLFQLIHLHFTAPRRDAEAFAAYRERLVSTLENRSAMPISAFQDTLTVTLAQRHPRSLPLTPAEAEALRLDSALRVYRERFADAGDFTFVLVGAFDPEEVAPLAKRYLASLPARPDSGEAARDLGIRTPGGVVERTVRRGLEPQARVHLTFSGDLQHDPARFDPARQETRYHAEQHEARRERYLLAALADALAIRLREELREERGGVYGVGVSAGVDRLTGTYAFHVSFGADPERVEELTEAVFAEVARFQTEGPPAETVRRVVEAGRRDQETNLRQNSYWLSALAAAYRHDEPPEEHLFRDDLRQRLTTTSLRDTARRTLDRRRHVRVVLLPEATP
jgi:zinc protease